MLNDNEMRQVVTAVASILKEGQMPPNVPPKYRKALQDLADAREDRSAGRRGRFELAEKELKPVLAAADRSSMVSMTKRALGIDNLMTSWRQLCSSGPAPLPVPPFHAKYEHVYSADGSETVEQVARKFGFEDASPLTHPSYGYAANMHLRNGDRIFVPFTPTHLEQLIESSEHMIEGAAEGAKEALERQFENQEEFEAYLLQIEAISILANLSAALVEGVVITSKVLGATENAVAHAGAHEMLHWLKVEGPKTVRGNSRRRHRGVEGSQEGIHPPAASLTDRLAEPDVLDRAWHCARQGGMGALDVRTRGVEPQASAGAGAADTDVCRGSHDQDRSHAQPADITHLPVEALSGVRCHPSRRRSTSRHCTASLP